MLLLLHMLAIIAHTKYLQCYGYHSGLEGVWRVPINL